MTTLEQTLQTARYQDLCECVAVDLSLEESSRPPHELQQRIVGALRHNTRYRTADPNCQSCKGVGLRS